MIYCPFNRYSFKLCYQIYGKHECSMNLITDLLVLFELTYYTNYVFNVTMFVMLQQLHWSHWSVPGRSTHSFITLTAHAL